MLGPMTSHNHIFKKMAAFPCTSLCQEGKIFTRRYLEEFPCFVSITSCQFSSVAQSCPTLCDPMNCSTPGFPVHHQLPKSTQTHVHRVGDAIQPSHPLSSPSPPALNRPSIIRVFSSESAFRIRWPKDWNFSLNIFIYIYIYL